MQFTTIHCKSESNQKFVPTLIDSNAGQQRMTTLLAFCSSWLWYVGCSQETYISQLFSLTSASFHQRRKKNRNLPQLLSLHHHYLSMAFAAADTTVSASHMETDLSHTWEQAALGTWLLVMFCSLLHLFLVEQLPPMVVMMAAFVLQITTQ